MKRVRLCVRSSGRKKANISVTDSGKQSEYAVRWAPDAGNLHKSRKGLHTRILEYYTNAHSMMRVSCEMILMTVRTTGQPHPAARQPQKNRAPHNLLTQGLNSDWLTKVWADKRARMCLARHSRCAWGCSEFWLAASLASYAWLIQKNQNNYSTFNLIHKEFVLFCTNILEFSTPTSYT